MSTHSEQPIKPSEQPAKKKKSALREWLDSIVFAVVVATFIRWLFIEAYTIPTPSMENSLLVGDFLFVSKMHYGARTPETPLQIPLTFQRIWGTNIPSYLDWIQMPMFRLPGFSEVKRMDPVVFNCPTDPDDRDCPVDMKTYYIKRCIGLPGDTLSIRDQQVHINGQAAENPAKMLTSYTVISKEPINVQRVFIDKGIRQFRPGIDQGTFYNVHCNEEQAQYLKGIGFLKQVEKDLDTLTTLPDSVVQYGATTSWNPTIFGWNVDNFGPLYLPKAGETMQMTPENLTKYAYIILNYEFNDDAVVKEGQLFIGGQAIKEYTFKQDYYFMMGDNRHDSADSRFWGLVPADHIVGKALFTWWSMNDKPGANEGLIRWNRIFRLIE